MAILKMRVNAIISKYYMTNLVINLKMEFALLPPLSPHTAQHLWFFMVLLVHGQALVT